MAKQSRNFVNGRMNKSVDERLLPVGDYVDAMNVRVGSTELTEIGAVENSKGNSKITSLQYNGAALSGQATCIGTHADSEQETIYWFVHDPACTQAINGKVDMIVSYDTTAQQLTYHVVTELLLNFEPAYLINSVDKIDDLLFFTDNYNEPRKINVTRDYSFPDVTALPADVDEIIELDISVIKPPPLEAPTIEFAQIAGGENYIEDTFICFAYRYQYIDGEYSALSQFTAPAFAPDVNFSLGASSYLNDSMQNIWNQANVTFDTGVEQVIGVDLVFKEADSNNIFVIDEYDVESLIGQTQNVSFTNGEIYTVLRSDEILRLYDNVPLKSKAQNIFGNRLLYGNYVEQRDLTDSTGQEIDLTYGLEVISSERAGGIDIDVEFGTYGGINVDSTLAGGPNITQGRAEFDFSGITSDDLILGNFIQFSLQFRGAGFSYLGGYPENTNAANESFNTAGLFSITLTVRLDQDYTTATDFFQGSYFREVWGWNQASPVPSDWSSGVTWMDIFNAAVPSVNNDDEFNNPLSYQIVPCMATRRQAASPQNNTAEPVATDTGPTNDHGGIGMEWNSITDVLTITPPAHRYRQENLTSCNNWNARQFQYFSFVTAQGVVFGPTSSRSLHSNREYQVGIVYQDSNARQSTVLVSELNSVNVDARNSINLNHIEVTIPTGMRPPSWAERYKFMLKPSQGLYETVYANVAFFDVNTGMTWIKLEGEQTNKVTEGLRLIVKSDANGPLNNVITTTVLEVASQGENFLEDDPTPFVQPAGVYMRVRTVGWSADIDLQDSFSFGNSVSWSCSKSYAMVTYFSDDRYSTPYLIIPLSVDGTNISINQGDIVAMRFHFKRNGIEGRCTLYECLYDEQIVATQDYADFKQFWDLQGVNVSVGSTCSGNGSIYDPAMMADPPPVGTWLPDNNPNSQTDNLYQFWDDTIVTNGLTLVLQAGQIACCQKKGRDSAIYADISIVPANGNFVFETIPNKVADGIYYEGADNYPITNGNHMANPAEVDGDVDQVVGTTQGVVNLSFFNCFAFGNGVESYRILDSLTGNYFTLGNRSAGVTTQDYEQIRRESSITYSGLYQEQTALNNLNNFNLGLANYKDCEESYGPIEILHSFRDNLLVLQEDKISYIQVNKSLISGADGSNIVTAAPTILGTQIARVEEYGISNNPESFATYGRDMFFTDAKRSSVIKLSGSVGQGDALQVISSIGMRSWFRDLFQESFTTQKLGGYDPYMNEYILASNTTNLPLQIPITGCRSRADESYLAPIQWLGLTSQTQYIVNAGNGIGSMDFTFTQTHTTAYTITYNGVITGPTTGTAGAPLLMTITKDIASISEVYVTVNPTEVNLDSITTMFPLCPTGAEIKVVMVCLTDSQDANQTVINQHNYVDGSYTSPLVQETVTFNSGSTSPIVSQFNETTGIGGTAGFPSSSSTVTMGANRTGSTPNDFQFNPSLNEFAYVFGNSLGYTNTPAGITSMLAASTSVAIDGTQAPDLYTGDFNVFGVWNELYLIYDYRRAGSAMFCHSTSIDPTDSDEVCCDCTANLGCTPFLGTNPVSATSSLACAIASASYTYYHNGNNIAPSIGNTIYSAPDCASGVLLGTDNYIKLGDGSNEYIRVNSSGIIIDKTSC